VHVEQNAAQLHVLQRLHDEIHIRRRAQCGWPDAIISAMMASGLRVVTLSNGTPKIAMGARSAGAAGGDACINRQRCSIPVSKLQAEKIRLPAQFFRYARAIDNG
jgi:hypothetical protein